MKRDLDLVRAILIWIEGRPEGHNVNWRIAIDGFTDEQISYHVHLMGQAGLLVTTSMTSLDPRSPSAVAISMTWAGHEFLSAARDDTLWAKAKTKVIGPAGSAVFTVLLDWLKAEAKTYLGLGP